MSGPPPTDPPPTPPPDTTPVEPWSPASRDDWVDLFADGFKKAQETAEPPPPEQDEPPKRKPSFTDLFLGKPR